MLNKNSQARLMQGLIIGFILIGIFFFSFVGARDGWEEPVRYTPPYSIGEKCYSSYDSENKIMTDTSCLQFKTETNGVITINNERYLAFALKGIIDGEEIIRTSMDFIWTWLPVDTTTIDGHIFTAEAELSGFIWKQHYYFYKDYSKPMKIEHYLENNLADITDMQMYYLTTVLPDDEIEYNETSYLVSDYIGLHKQGNFNELISTLNFNAEYNLNFEDLIDNGFTINEFYIGSGSVIGKPNVNITAIGFTNNNGNFPEGSSVWIDPTFTTEDVEWISIAPLTEDSFVIAWFDEVGDDVEFLIYGTDGVADISQVTVDSSMGPIYRGDIVDVSAFNSTNFVIAWIDEDANNVQYAIYDSAGSIVGSPVEVYAIAGGQISYAAVSVSAINETAFVIGWYDRGDTNDIFFSVYDFAGNVLTDDVSVGDVAGGYSSISVSALNDTAFVIGWNDLDNDNIAVSIYSVGGTLLAGPIVAYDGAIIPNAIVSVSVFNETAFVIAWANLDDDDVEFSYYHTDGTKLSGPHDADTDIGTAVIVSLSAINNTHFVLAWEDTATDEFSIATYIPTSPTSVSGIVDVATGTQTDIVAVASRELTTGINLSDDKIVFAYTTDGPICNFTVYNSDLTVYSPDTTPPYFTDGTPTNQTIDNVTALSYDINASDETGLSGLIIDDTTNFTINFASGLLTNNTQLKVGYHPINVTINDTSNNKNSTMMSVNVTEAVLDTCTCPGAGNNWEVDMEDSCNLTTACNLGTGNLSWIGSSGYFNCSANLNLTNRDAPPSNTIFHHSSGCEIIYLIILIFISTASFKRKGSLT